MRSNRTPPADSLSPVPHEPTSQPSAFSTTVDTRAREDVPAPNAPVTSVTPGMTLQMPTDPAALDALLAELESWEQSSEIARCAADVVYWIDTYCTTFDPRNSAGERTVPFILYPRQVEFVRWLEQLERDREAGLVEKSRDSGVSYICCAYALHSWLFKADDSTGFGSRKLDQVDTLGDPSSLFEKIRMLLRSLPAWMLPNGFAWRKHSGQAKLLNPSNGSTIIGEGGDDIGRGGRTSRYFVDEAAHIERPRLLDASLSATTNVRIDISTPRGLNEFYERRMGGIKVFTLHWHDDPRKNSVETLADGRQVYPWYERQKLRPDYTDPNVLAQEIDIDYVGSGSPYYNRAFLMGLKESMVGTAGNAAHDPLYKVAPGEEGWHAGFSVYREPKSGRNYVIAIDPAEGPDSDGKNDFTSMKVFDLEDWEECVDYHGRPDPWDAGADAAALAAWYNDAVVGVLRLNHGHTVIRSLIEHGHTQVAADKDGKLGYVENLKTKPEMDDALGAVFNDMVRGEPGLVLHDAATVQECITYAHLGSGKAGAEGSSHDDRQSCLKTIVKMLRMDDRRYRLPIKEPPPSRNVYGGHWQRRRV